MDEIFKGLKDIFTGDHSQDAEGEILSSDQDPYGDPGREIKSSNEDPYGDPGASILSSDEDPYGDPGRR